MIYLRLFFEFFKTGLFSVGGGLATLPFLYDMSDKTGWFSRIDLANMIAVSESTPGPMGVNMATYVGFETAGILGAVVAVTGLVAPSVIIVLLIAGVLDRFRSSKIVGGVFYALRPASCALIAAAGFTVAEIALLNLSAFMTTGLFADLLQWKYVAICAVVLVLTRWVKPTKKLHPIVFIIGSALAGIAFGVAGI